METEDYSLETCLAAARVIARVNGMHARRLLLIGDNSSGDRRAVSWHGANKAAGVAMRRIREINFLLDLPGEK